MTGELPAQVRPAKEQKLVTLPAAALLQPLLFFQPAPFVCVYRAPSAVHSAALLDGSQVKAARATAATVSRTAARSRAGAIAPLARAEVGVSESVKKERSAAWWGREVHPPSSAASTSAGVIFRLPGWPINRVRHERCPL